MKPERERYTIAQVVNNVEEVARAYEEGRSDEHYKACADICPRCRESQTTREGVSRPLERGKNELWVHGLPPYDDEGKASVLVYCLASTIKERYWTEYKKD